MYTNNENEKMLIGNHQRSLSHFSMGISTPKTSGTFICADNVSLEDDHAVPTRASRQIDVAIAVPPRVGAVMGRLAEEAWLRCSWLNALRQECKARTDRVLPEKQFSGALWIAPTRQVEGLNRTCCWNLDYAHLSSFDDAHRDVANQVVDTRH
jgi:hypothetical protein